MNLTDSVSLTPKGVEEVTNRTYKIGIRPRSVIIFLGKPQTLEHILQAQQLYKPEETIEIINDLAKNGFVAINGKNIAGSSVSASGGNIRLAEGIIISEAKFLLVDFCVDSFGTQSQKFVDELGECKNEKSLELCLQNIYATTEMLNPDNLPVLLKIIREINATA